MTPVSRLATGAAWAAFSILIVAGAGCGGERGSEGDRPDPAARRIAFREQLRRELGAEYEAPLPPLEQEQFARGAGIYARLCESCHGLAGRGNGLSGRMLATPPPDLADAEQAAFFSDRAKLRIVRQGAPATPMIGWNQVLTDEECKIVLQYLLDLALPQFGSEVGEAEE